MRWPKHKKTARRRSQSLSRERYWVALKIWSAWANKNQSQNPVTATKTPEKTRLERRFCVILQPPVLPPSLLMSPQADCAAGLWHPPDGAPILAACQPQDSFSAWAAPRTSFRAKTHQRASLNRADPTACAYCATLLRTSSLVLDKLSWGLPKRHRPICQLFPTGVLTL